MKHEILKKTMLYRILGFGLSMFITTLIFFTNPMLSLNVSIATEASALGLYYAYEYLWRRYTEHKKLKEGVHIFSIGSNRKVLLEYNVLEDLGDGKILIEIV